MRILVAQDDEYAQPVVAALRTDAHEPVLAQTLPDALRLARGERFDLAVLEMTLGEERDAGIEICRELKRHSPGTLIVFCSARRATADIVAGLAGGDDYITKPFDPGELIARLRAATRRGQVAAPASATRRIAALGLDLHFGSSRAYLEGNDIGCTPHEFQLLALLTRYPGQVLSETFLLQQLDGPGTDGAGLGARVDTLRRKMREAGGEDAIHLIDEAHYSFTPV